MKKEQLKMYIGLLILALAAFGSSACSASRAEAHKTETATTTTVKPTVTPTPYKPLKRVSRDIIKTDAKDEPAKETPVKVKAKQ